MIFDIWIIMRILIVEVNWLGDVLFSTPAIKALRKKFPDSFIACLIVPRVGEILEGSPYINELIINDEKGLHSGFWGKLRLAKELRKKKFDLAILFHRSSTRALIAYLAGIPRRVGYATWKRRFLLTDCLPMPKKDSTHRVDYYLDIVKALGCDSEDRLYEFFTTEEDVRFARDFLAAEGIARSDFIVCLNPGGNWPPKRWPKENFAGLADKLIGSEQAKVVFCGSQNDRELIADIVSQMSRQPEGSSLPSDRQSHQPIIAAGRTNLKQLAGIFKRADLVISGDSGPLHIAASLGRDIIGLFGPTSVRVSGPLGRGKIKIMQKDSDCRIPCYDKDCRDNLCMQKITPEDVFSEIKDFLAVKKNLSF
ncbi:MAG: lipopolysaccharide heptosyltransferase II [Omnitrophica WOR_2 bacterium RIFCSPLOWO2_12_FULL_46_30]|nr:MAG: lipopolysaccharide heptosyltransferase II [Omnitrophica WOR_2 bacterium RIFCSPLOWO2_12_FULL_46_30]